MGRRRAIDFGGYVMDVVQTRGEGWQADAYPFNLPAVRSWETLELHDKVTFLVGENGSGKSTLIEAIAIAAGFNAEGGSRNFRFGTAHSHSDLHEHLRLVRATRRPRDGFFLRAESYFNVATYIDDLDKEGGGPSLVGSYGGKSLHNRSHGESFMALLTERFGGRGFYVLDEPEAALSPQRQTAFLKRLHELVKDDSQFVIATHSPMILAYPDAWIYEMGPDGPQRVNWEALEHVRLTRDFLMYPEAYLYEIMEAPEE
ncbi:MAG: AAA family ATPase [Hyphomonas sp.]|nr:AAA family ATPase [Hyphomonas sp.]